MRPDGEEVFIAEHLAPLTEGFPGAYGLQDDCAELAPLPGHALIFKTDPIIEGVHFFGDDAPEDVAWKALAVNVSDLAAKGARPVAYLMALTLSGRPDASWVQRFARGLQAAQDAFGCVLIGGDTDVRPGINDAPAPLSIAITAIGEARAGAMVERRGAEAGDAIFVSGALGGAALGLQLRLDAGFTEAWPLEPADREAARQRYLRPRPKLGLRVALQAYANAAMDISDGLIKDLDRMCRLTGVGAMLEWDAIPLAAGLRLACGVDQAGVIQLATAGDDYEILAAVPAKHAAAFARAASQGGTDVTRIGTIGGEAGVRLLDANRSEIAVGATGYDHFDGR